MVKGQKSRGYLKLKVSCVKIQNCVSKTDDRGCSNTGEESPGFIGQGAG